MGSAAKLSLLDAEAQAALVRTGQVSAVEQVGAARPWADRLPPVHANRISPTEGNDDDHDHLHA